MKHIMRPWPKNPVIYEINTWVWLGELGRKYGKTVTLATVPSEEWDCLSSIGADAVWLMGVWERSPRGVEVALKNEGLMADFRRALPDLAPGDVVGSPYCVRRYVVDERLGGPEGLAAARNMLGERGLRLILDFVPNHVAPDHPWVLEHPDYFIRGNADDLLREPRSFLEVGGNVFACGRDPYFPAWPDVLQLNAFDPGLRQAVAYTLSDIAAQCDGIRCDMAMLMMNDIFARTWGGRAGERPLTEYWRVTIRAAKMKYPDFLFIAEAYWDLEWELQQQGFDYCYDKRLYDRLVHDNAESVRLHLCAESEYQNKVVRFIENHDEPRAASEFNPQKELAAAVTVATIPGARLFHEGQFEGRKVRLPVFLGRRPDEPEDKDLHAFYHTLLKAAASKCFHDGDWRLCELNGWHDNASYLNLVAWCWRYPGEHRLVVVNLSGSGAQGRVRLAWDEMMGRSWRMTDIFTQEVYDRSGDEMCAEGLYVDLPPWGYNVFSLTATPG